MEAGVTGGGGNAAQLREKKKSNLQFAPKVRLTDQVRTSIR